MSTKIEDKPIAHAGADSSPRCAVSPGSAETCGCGKPATKTTDDGERLCSACYAAVPNEYDLAFVKWFASHGWQIHVTPSGVDVWTNGDARCPFRVTRGMIERLEWSGKIERIFPRDAAVLDYVWVISPNAGDVARAGNGAAPKQPNSL